MPAITRSGDSCTGHDRCPPRPATNGAPTVSAGGKPVLREGDHYALHGCKNHAPHDAVLAQGAPHVSIAGKAVGRVGDPVSCGGAAAEGEASVTIGNLGGEEYGRELAFEMVKERILSKSSSASESTRPTDMEKLLLCLPDIAEAEAEESWLDNDRKGWMQLRTFFHKWFSGSANLNAETSTDIFWIDMDWVLSYRRIVSVYTSLIMDDFLFNLNAQNTLARILKRDGFLGNERIPFDYTNPQMDSESKRPWREWKDGYFQSITVPGIYIMPVDGISACMGSFVLRTLAAGYTIPLPDGGHSIVVERVSVFAWDSFNFNKEDELGYWSCEEKDFDLFPDPINHTYDQVFNRHFNAFRKKYGAGNDFMVLSNSKNIDFLPRFQYDTKL